MDLSPQWPPLPRTLERTSFGSDSLIKFQNQTSPETKDAFQAWMHGLFNWEIDEICDAKRHSSPQVSNTVDEKVPSSDWQSQVGNFSRSSRHYFVGSDCILQAQCQTLDGEYHYCALSLRSIIMGLNGEFHWLDGTVRSPNCSRSNASDWELIPERELHPNQVHPWPEGFWVAARCRDDSGDYQKWRLTLDERISNDNGRLKLITPLGLLAIPLFTDYHVSTVAIAMVMGIERREPSKQSEIQIDSFLRSQQFAQSSKFPLSEGLDGKAATLISLMWIRFCRQYTVYDLIRYRDVCKAIDDRLRDRSRRSHELKVLLEHYREMPSDLWNYAVALMKETNKTWQPFFIDEAVHTLQMLLEVTAENDKGKSVCGQALCQLFLLKFEATSKLDDLHSACDLAKTFCTTDTEDDSEKAFSLTMLAGCKWEEDKLSGEQKNRKAIIDALEKAAECSTGLNQHTIRQMLCLYHIENLSAFEIFDLAELNNKLKLLEIAPDNNVEVPLKSEIVRWRCKSQGLKIAFMADPRNLSLIHKAIECAEKSCSLFKTARDTDALNHRVFALSLTAYAQALAIRFKITEASDDLGRIIGIYEEALEMCKSFDKVRIDILHGLALHQLLWHEHKGALEMRGQSSACPVLSLAFQNAKSAYENSRKYGDAYGLYAWLYIRAWALCFGALGKWSFLDEAIRILEHSHEEILYKKRASTILEAEKCQLLFQRYLLQRSLDSYNEAMNAARHYSQRNSLKVISGPHEVTEIMLGAMAAFELKANSLKEDLPVEDVDFVTQHCCQILNLDGAQMRDRIQAGDILGSLYGARNEWGEATKAYGKVIILIKQLINRSLSQSDREWLLKRFSWHLPSKAGFAALYAAKATGSSAEEIALSTLQNLESSRGILASLIFKSRLNLEILRSEDENAAKEYESLLQKLTLLESVTSVDWVQTSSSNDNSTSTNVVQRRAEIAKRLSELEDRSAATTDEIGLNVLKNLGGQSAFVQVMASSHASIALLGRGTELRTIELPELKASEIVMNLERLYGNARLSKAEPLQVAEAGRELREILKWLWISAVQPILLELGYYTKFKRGDSNQLPRLWWCASDITSKLPFHAAGKGPGSENVYDYAVCSVTVSLTALKMARGNTEPLKKILNDGVLAVSMPTTSGWNPLNAEKELKLIKEAMSTNLTHLTNPTKAEVTKRLGEHGIIHFICHGTSIAEDSSSSALVLGHQEASAAERLTVKELGNIAFRKARIAFLSACSTAENSSYKLADESIHLASAFQLAGFSHVIGTFWEAKDRSTIPLAGFFYQNLAKASTELNPFESNHDAVAYALHEALRKVRQNKNSGNPLCWAPFVHIGA